MTKLTFRETMTMSEMFGKMHKTKEQEFKQLPIEEQKEKIAEYKAMSKSEKITFECENKMLVKLQLKFPDEDVHNDYTKVSYRAITADNFDKIDRLNKELDNVRLIGKAREEKLVELANAKKEILNNQLGNNDKSYEKSMNWVRRAEKLQEVGDALNEFGEKTTRKGVKFTAMAWAPLPYLGYSVVKDAHRGGKHGNKGKQEEIKIVPDTSNGDSELVGMVKAIDIALSNGTIDKDQAKEILNDYINTKY